MSVTRERVLVIEQAIHGGGADAETRPSCAFGDGDTGLFEASDDNLSFTTNGTEKLKISGQAFFINNSGLTDNPATPIAGGILFVSGGALVFKGSSGTITQIAAP